MIITKSLILKFLFDKILSNPQHEVTDSMGIALLLFVAGVQILGGICDTVGWCQTKRRLRKVIQSFQESGCTVRGDAKTNDQLAFQIVTRLFTQPEMFKRSANKPISLLVWLISGGHVEVATGFRHQPPGAVGLYRVTDEGTFQFRVERRPALIG